MIMISAMPGAYGSLAPAAAPGSPLAVNGGQPSATITAATIIFLMACLSPRRIANAKSNRREAGVKPTASRRRAFLPGRERQFHRLLAPGRQIERLGQHQPVVRLGGGGGRRRHAKRNAVE